MGIRRRLAKVMQWSAGTPAVARDAQRMSRVITWVAASIAVIVATVGPAAYLVLGWNFQRIDASLSAQLYATFITQAAAISRGDWRQDVQGLVDAPLRESEMLVSEHREVRDDHGMLVTESAEPARPPEIVERAPLAGRDGVIGEVVLHRSIRPLLVDASGAALLAAGLGLAIYASLRVWPMRVLGLTLEALRAEQRRSRRVLERQLEVLFEQAGDGMLVFDAQGRVRSCNPEAARLLGAGIDAIVGRPLAQWIRRPGSHPDAMLEPGKWEGHILRAAGDASPSPPVEVAVHALAEGELFCLLRDITERRSAEERMTRLAQYDSLTGLPNRSLFRDRLQAAMARSVRHGRQVALMFLDLDRFKAINDTLGHHVGDLLLKHVAQCLRSCLRASDDVGLLGAGDVGATVSRLGGDEFTVIVGDLDGAPQAAATARRILAALRTPLHAAGQEIVVSSSIGITLYPADPSPLDELIRHADMAMYRAKQEGRSGYRFHEW